LSQYTGIRLEIQKSQENQQSTKPAIGKHTKQLTAESKPDTLPLK